MNALIFNEITLTPVKRPDNQIWLTSTDLAKALGYVKPDAVAQIYNRNADEFTIEMTQLIDISRDPQIEVQGNIKGLQNKRRAFRHENKTAFSKAPQKIPRPETVKIKLVSATHSIS